MKYEQIEGKNSVVETFKSGTRVFELLVQSGMREDARVRWAIQTAKSRKIPVTFLSKDEIDKLSMASRHQGLIARVETYKYASLPGLLKRVYDSGEDAMLVMLDGITDPHNLGSIIRTAEAAGAHGLILPKHRSAPVNPVVFHTSAGAAEYLPVATVPNLVSVAKRLKEEGIWIVGADERAEATCFEADLSGPTVLVLGAEGQGISRLLRETCDTLVRIPMVGKIGSLNVSVAAGVLLYELRRRRGF